MTDLLRKSHCFLLSSFRAKLMARAKSKNSYSMFLRTPWRPSKQRCKPLRANAIHLFYLHPCLLGCVALPAAPPSSAPTSSSSSSTPAFTPAFVPTSSFSQHPRRPFFHFNLSSIRSLSCPSLLTSFTSSHSFLHPSSHHSFSSNKTLLNGALFFGRGMCQDAGVTLLGF